MSLFSIREGGWPDVEMLSFFIQKRLPDDDVREIFSGGFLLSDTVYLVYQFRVCEFYGCETL